jgi:hypothetical protein
MQEYLEQVRERVMEQTRRERTEVWATLLVRLDAIYKGAMESKQFAAAQGALAMTSRLTMTDPSLSARLYDGSNTEGEPKRIN